MPKCDQYLTRFDFLRCIIDIHVHIKWKNRLTKFACHSPRKQRTSFTLLVNRKNKTKFHFYKSLSFLQIAFNFFSPIQAENRFFLCTAKCLLRHLSKWWLKRTKNGTQKIFLFFSLLSSVQLCRFVYASNYKLMNWTKSFFRINSCFAVLF